MSQINKDKKLLLEMLCKHPDRELKRIGIDNVVQMSTQELEDLLIGN